MISFLHPKFPSPINGVSFKPMFQNNKIYKVLSMFPSPISGVSFKQRRSFIMLDWLFGKKFPSPISGVSFKLVHICCCSRYLTFPSPISGVSFKPCALEPASLLGWKCTLRLRTGFRLIEWAIYFKKCHEASNDAVRRRCRFFAI